jgi:hypothetical protein
MMFQKVRKLPEQCSALAEAHKSLWKWLLELFSVSDIPAAVHFVLLRYFWQLEKLQVLLLKNYDWNDTFIRKGSTLLYGSL